MLFENLTKVAQPFVLGIAVNDLIGKSSRGLWMFCMVYAIGFVLGIARRFYDTRAYTFIYKETATTLVGKQQRQNIELSVLSARTALLKELVDFFEYDASQALAALISVIGALIMLLFYDFWIFIACLLCIVLILLIYKLSESKILNFNTNLNDELEERIKVLENKTEKEVTANHFKNIAKWLVKLSDLETKNFGLIEVLLFITAIYSLYISATALNATAGSIFSTITYVLEFSNGIFMLPFVFQQLIRLQEISSRLEEV